MWTMNGWICSTSDHNAPYNEIDIIDEDGEEQIVCGCTACQKSRKRNDPDFGDYEYDRRKYRD